MIFDVNIIGKVICSVTSFAGIKLIFSVQTCVLEFTKFSSVSL
jgi:hypothetical protein